jgi:glycosyltransferase involved in cell wall biosynthesis
MRRFIRRHPRALLAANLALVAALLAYQLWLHVTDPRVESLHVDQVETIGEALEGRQRFRFAVVGNVNNSIRVFRDQIIPKLNAADIDFVVSAGNAVAGGQPESYRAVFEIFGRLKMPWLLTYGANEHSDFGSFRFYERFGPHFYSFVAGDAHFLFLDSTGKTPQRWQLRWLERELSASPAERRFVFIAHPVREPVGELPLLTDEEALAPADFRAALIERFERLGVDAVFSSHVAVFSDETVNGVRYVTTGGAGGLIVDREASFHHYVVVEVTPEGLRIEPVPLEIRDTPVLSTLDSLWSAIFTLVYVSFARFLLIILLLSALAIWLYRLIATERDYYPDFDIDAGPYRERALRIGMFTNNYYPFVGGVGVSIDRLIRGLRDLGDTTLLIAPYYARAQQARDDVLRVRGVFGLGEARDFPLPNPASPEAVRRMRAFGPHVIHVHHPFWLGWLGLWLGRRLRVPVVLTYHTRLEHYAHFVPLPGLLFRNLISHALIRRFANKCQGVVVPTESAEEYLRIIGVKSHTLVQPTGIDFEAAQHIDADALSALRAQHGLGGVRRVLVCACRLSREKNIDFMLEALAELPEPRREQTRLLLIGDGPDRAHIEARIAALGLQSMVQLVGAVPPERMPLYYSLGDVFVFASRSETQGMVILEAMATGLPVVAVRSSGIDDVVQHDVNGYKTRGDRRQWREHLQMLLDDDALRARLSAQALETARAHDIRHFARAVHDFYAYLIAERARQAESEEATASGRP